MTITLLIGAVWLAGLLAVMAVCRSAARGDRDLMALGDPRRADSHERPLAA